MTLLFLLAIAAALAILAAHIAEKKGYNGGLAGILTFVALLCAAIPGIIVIIIYLLLPAKHRYCPNCGERNIHFLTRCRRCDTPL